MAPLQARCHLGLGGVHQRMGQEEDARRELAQAVTMLQAMQMRYWLQKREDSAPSPRRQGRGPRSARRRGEPGAPVLHALFREP